MIWAGGTARGEYAQHAGETERAQHDKNVGSTGENIKCGQQFLGELPTVAQSQKPLT